MYNSGSTVDDIAVGSMPRSDADLPLWVRVLRRMERWLRPALGWIVLITCLVLAWLPGEAAQRNEWLVLRETGATVEPIGPLAVLTVWLLWGWRRNRASLRRGKVPGLLRALLLTLVGVLVLTQALVRWLPGPALVVSAIRVGNPSILWDRATTLLAGLGVSLLRWGRGVLAGGAAQDDLVFAAVAGVLLWCVGCWTARLARQGRDGLLVAVPSLWLLGFALMYGPTGRALLVFGLLLAVLLHLVLDQQQLMRRWAQGHLDYHPGIFLERFLLALGICALIFGLAGVFPNVGIRAISDRYYQFFAPVNVQVEDIGERLFPELRATSRFRGTSVATGLPNDFLLGSGPELSRTEVMRVLTDEPVNFDPLVFEEMPPTGHYMRGGTLTVYNGLGWEHTSDLQEAEFAGDELLGDRDESIYVRSDMQERELPPGRRLLLQDVYLSFNSYALYASPELVAASIDYRTEGRAENDISGIWANGTTRRVRNYTVASAIPAVSEAQLAAEPEWGEVVPLPDAYAIHLGLPDTITERTRQLAQELTQDAVGPYAKAQAIEAYLRDFEYDLNVSDPPASVEDVADYFLFDLQRGYCDYYATAFVVLARLNGLPARFATGFASGYWNAADGMFMITEAEAHSWPEVYFPTYGWIPFEPTAGRLPLLRIGLPGSVEPLDFEPVAPIDSVAVESERDGFWAWDWNWQMLVWLVPLGLLMWGAYALWNLWSERRDDPWQGILRWGARVGRPLGEGETVLEYGQGLAEHTLQQGSQEQDTRRIVAREVQAISQEVSAIHYGTAANRSAATERAVERWQVLRGYLRRLRS